VTRAGDWWKFDLPPGWQAYTDAELSSVCAFQWKAADSAILDHLGVGAQDDGSNRYLRVHFEDLVRGGARRRQVLESVASWMGVRFTETGPDEARLQMVTAPPSAGRWRKRRASIAPILRRPDIRGLAAALGYSAPSGEWP
jgi:hypothetical protein